MIPAILGSFLVANAAGDQFSVALALNAYRTHNVARPDGVLEPINVARWQQTLTYEGGPRSIVLSAAWNALTPYPVTTQALRAIARAWGEYHLGPTVSGTVVAPVAFPLYPALIDQLATGPYAGLRASGRAACVRPLAATEDVATFIEWVEPYFVAPPV